MAANVIVDAGFLVALLSGRDANHRWAVAQAARLPPPWKTCEGALSDAFRLLGPAGAPGLGALLHRRVAVCAFHLDEEAEHLVKLMAKYAHMPMSLADACVVRMTEILSDPIVLTTDPDFRLYRRHGRKTVPCVWPGRSATHGAVGPRHGGKSHESKSDLDDILQDVSRIFGDER